MTNKPASWRLVLLSYPCPTCLADVGEPCTTTGGKRADIPHAARADAARRCAVCGTRLMGTDPGALCPRHQLLADLNTERATKHVREDP